MDTQWIAAMNPSKGRGAGALRNKAGTRIYFPNEGFHRHNPEFTTVEVYRAYARLPVYDGARTENLITAAQEVLGTLQH